MTVNSFQVLSLKNNTLEFKNAKPLAIPPEKEYATDRKYQEVFYDFSRCIASRKDGV